MPSMKTIAMMAGVTLAAMYIVQAMSKTDGPIRKIFVGA